MSADPADPPGPVLGLDIGGTKLAVGIVSQDGQVHGRQIMPTHRERGPDDVIGRMFTMADAAMRGPGPALRPTAVGISCGGPLDTGSGILHSPPHLPGWDEVPLGDMTRARFGLPVAFQNDATAAALAEHRYGTGVSSRTMLYLTLSTGVGGGAIIDGRLMHGAAGNGGEFGHLSVLPGGRPCSCGRRGCLEAYCSGTSIAERAAELLGRSPRGFLATLPNPVTAADVAAGVRIGDELCLDLWDETVHHLATALIDLVNVFEPDLVVLGGGVTRSGDLLLDRVSHLVAQAAMPPAGHSASIRLAGLGDLVGVVGAGAVAFDLLGESERTHVL